jgi:hypothetical protein
MVATGFRVVLELGFTVGERDILPAEVVILPGANLIGNADTTWGQKLLPATQERR